jgi:hypothetical protein
MRQIIAAIVSRRQTDRDIQRFYIEWQTRALASFIGATAWAGGNKLIDAASKLSMIPTLTKEEAEAKADNPNEPKRGSFERFGMMMGKVVRPPQTREDVHEPSGSEAGD